MKTTTLLLILFLTALASWAQPASSPRRAPQRINLAGNTNTPTPPQLPGAPAAGTPAAAPAASAAFEASPAAAASKPPEEVIPAGNINFQGVDVSQVLDVYAMV